MDFEEVYKRYYQDVFRFCLSMCRSAHIADDITSETFLKAIKEIEEDETANWRDKHRFNEFGLDPDEYNSLDDFLKALDRITDIECEKEDRDQSSKKNKAHHSNTVEKEKHYLISQMPGGTKDIFESNPYCVLGIPCNSTRSIALETYDKLKKLHKLGALKTYKSSFDLKCVEQPKRDLGNLNVILSNLDKLEHRWFWFLNEDYIKLWDKPIFLYNINDWDIDYDKFLIRYIAVLVIDPSFNEYNKWSVIIKMLDRLCSLSDQELYEILSKRISTTEKKKYNYRMVTNNFRDEICKPLIENFINTDGDTLYNLIKMLERTKGHTKEKITPIIKDAVSKWIDSSLCDLKNFVNQIELKKKLSESTSSEASEVLSILNKLEESFLKAEKITSIIGGLQSEVLMNKFATPIYEATIILQSGGKRTESYKYDSLIYKYCDEFQRKEIKRVTPSSYLNSA